MTRERTILSLFPFLLAPAIWQSSSSPLTLSYFAGKRAVADPGRLMCNMLLLKTLYSSVRFSLAMRRSLPAAHRKTTFDIHLQYTTERMPSGNAPLHLPASVGGGLCIYVLPAGKRRGFITTTMPPARSLSPSSCRFLCLFSAPVTNSGTLQTSSRLDRSALDSSPGPPDRLLGLTVTSGVPTGQRRHANARCTTLQHHV